MATERPGGRLVASAAVMAGATAASSGLGGGGDKFGSALEAESGNLFLDLTAIATRALNLAILIENDLFKIVPAFLAMKFENRHKQTPFFIITNKEGKATRIQWLLSYRETWLKRKGLFVRDGPRQMDRKTGPGMSGQRNNNRREPSIFLAPKKERIMNT